MAGGPRWLPLLLLLRISINGKVVHRRVGGTVELDPRTEGRAAAELSRFYWKLGKERIIDTLNPNNVAARFRGRLELHRNTSVLTLRELQVKDSGTYIFSSWKEDEQQRSIKINLQVHEPIEEKPSVTANSTWDPLNDSCQVFLSCWAAGHEDVSYSWSLKGRDPLKGPRVRVQVWPGVEDTLATCTAFNSISNQSAEAEFKCSNSTYLSPGFVSSVTVMATAAILVGVFSAAVALHRKRKRADGHDDGQTLYAYIMDAKTAPGPQNPTSRSVTALNTLYESINSLNEHPAQASLEYEKIRPDVLKKPAPPPRRAKGGLDQRGASK